MGDASVHPPRAAVWPVPPGRSVRIVLDRSVAVEADAAVDAEWERLRGQNPALYDAPILSVHRFDESRLEIRCRVLGYRHLACRARAPNPAELLSILGITLCADARGVEHVLLGRRSSSVRIYGGMWELAPAGGVPPPDRGREAITHAALMEHLALEFAEEVSPMLEASAARACEDAARQGRIVALARDPAAFSLDLAAIVRPPLPLERLTPARCVQDTTAWEYAELLWLARPEASAFDAHEQDRIIPTTRALLRVMGWVPLM
jgi:hypothetical protein